MNSKIKNILIFTVIGAALVLVYIFFIKPSDEENVGLVSTLPDQTTSPTDSASINDSLGTKDFLVVLLNVKNIKLDDSIFSDIAFSNLRDSSITLIPDGTEGRPNPFAPIGSDASVAPVNNSSVPKTTQTTTPSGVPPTVN